MRGWVCRLYLLLTIAGTVIFGSESHGTRDHNLLSQIRDFPFHRLLRLAGIRWRYLTPPPQRGDSSPDSISRSVSQSQSYVTTDGQSASRSGIKHPSGAYDQIFITVRHLFVFCCRAPSVTRVWVCLLQCTICNIFTFYMLSYVIHSLT
jgi:hypothetical protein